MLKPEGRMQAFRSTMLPIWAQNHAVFGLDIRVGAEMAPWIRNMAIRNGVSIEDFASDALYSGSFILSAVAMGLRVGRTNGHDWSGDLTPVLSGPVTEVLAATPVQVVAPVGTFESLNLNGYSPVAAAYYGMAVMRASMDRPVPGTDLVVAAVGDPDPGQPLSVHRGQSIAVPYMNPYGYRPI
jgi:hypothetical protein